MGLLQRPMYAQRKRGPVCREDSSMPRDGGGRDGVMHVRVRNAEDLGNHQDLTVTTEGPHPSALRRSAALPTPWPQTSGLQSCERCLSLVLSHSAWGPLSWPPQEVRTPSVHLASAAHVNDSALGSVGDAEGAGVLRASGL